MGFVVGFIVAGTVVGMVERIGHIAYPPPAGMDPSDPESIKAFMSQIPMGALLFIVVAWMVGSLAGSYTATRIARHSPRLCAAAVGGMMLFASVFMMITIPTPAWFWAAALVGVPLATAIPIMKLGAQASPTQEIRQDQRDETDQSPSGSAGSDVESG